MRLTLEQIDLIHRMCASYSELELVTSVKARRMGGGGCQGLKLPMSLTMTTLTLTCPQL